MSQTIYDKIESKGTLRVKDILAKAKIESEKIENDLITKATNDANNRVTKAKTEADKNLSYQKRLFDLEKRQALLTTKQEIIDEIFNEVLTKVLAFEGKDLLAYVIKLIKNEHAIGNEVIRVNKKDYKKFVKALSTNKEAKVVDADLLNKALNTTFTISNEPVEISNGFIIEGKDFDLNFTFEQIIFNLRKENEKNIVDELFE